MKASQGTKKPPGPGKATPKINHYRNPCFAQRGARRQQHGPRQERIYVRGGHRHGGKPGKEEAACECLEGGGCTVTVRAGRTTWVSLPWQQPVGGAALTLCGWAAAKQGMLVWAVKIRITASGGADMGSECARGFCMERGKQTEGRGAGGCWGHGGHLGARGLASGCVNRCLPVARCNRGVISGAELPSGLIYFSAARYLSRLSPSVR